jgi:hypothetical protein
MIGGMAKTSQTVILSIPTKTDIMALAVARQESQAEISRTLIDRALPRYKTMHSETLTALYEALERLGVDTEEALTEMATVRTRADGMRRTLTLKDVQEAATFPWPARRGTSARPAA